MDDLAIAAVKQHIGHRRVDVLTPRDREQMALTLGAGDLDQIAVGDARRLAEDRLGDLDLIILREPPNDPDRSVVDEGQLRAELLARAPLDPLNQEPQHALEQQDLILTVAISAGQKELGDAPHRLGAALGRAAMGRALKLDNEGLACLWLCHHASRPQRNPSAQLARSTKRSLIADVQTLGENR